MTSDKNSTKQLLIPSEKYELWQGSTIKVIIEKSRGEVSLVEQDTIKNVSEPIKFKFFFDHGNMKNPPSKVAHNRPKLFFSVLPTDPNPAQVSIPVP